MSWSFAGLWKKKSYILNRNNMSIQTLILNVSLQKSFIMTLQYYFDHNMFFNILKIENFLSIDLSLLNFRQENDGFHLLESC